MTEDMFAQKGWICPKCGRVLAPSTMYCLWCCNDRKETVTTAGTTIRQWDTTPTTICGGTIDSNCTGRSYFVGTSSISHEIAKTEPQTDWKDEMWTEAVEDEPQTICKECVKYPCESWQKGIITDKHNLVECCSFEPQTEPQTDCPKSCPTISICAKDDTDCPWK